MDQTNQPSVSGGPGDLKLQNQVTNPPVNTAPITPPVEPTPEPAVEKPVFVGGKKFKSAEELAVYTSELERQAAELKAQVPTPTEQTVLRDTRPKLGDLIFEDPEAFARTVEENATKRAKMELTEQQRNAQMWDKFFQEHADLSKRRDIVDLKRQELQMEWGSRKDLTPPMFFAELAKRSRSLISDIRGEAGMRETELSSGPARVADGGGGQGVRVESTIPESGDFVSQIRKLQKRK